VGKPAIRTEGSDAAERLLSEYFAEKRDGLRICRPLDASLLVRDVFYGATAVDVSISGIQLRIDDPAFATEEEGSQLLLFSAKVHQHLNGGFEVILADGAIRLPAEVVRVAGYCGSHGTLILVGCRFGRALSPAECELLGL
jgi:hypothetical protein